ncbi:hypothetical protein [Shinella zoogloeoides]|uniref:hypothetical protein n=1 Tax=Shinella zoogloeoides TaxID=352475 RepID=UPI00299E11DC|nr:hypothetical protein [Shinella zoogloeoides]WPE19924.1 hypothetical protein ShzoTeo12_11000 [Shinella zoogloeoides]
MKFVLVALASLNGDVHSFVLDGPMTYQDCRKAMAESVTWAEIVPGMWIDLSGAPLVCEPDAAPAVTVSATRMP